MPGWNLALRFGLEIVAFVGIGAGAWFAVSDVVDLRAARWAAVIIAPVVAMASWGTFNVIGDPSRSGRAPVVVAGTTRLVVELLILAFGFAGLATARPSFAYVFGGLAVIHYATSWPRITWLIAQRRGSGAPGEQ